MPIRVQSTLTMVYCLGSAFSLAFWLILLQTNMSNVMKRKSEGSSITEGIPVYQQVSCVFYGIAVLGSFGLCIFSSCKPKNSLKFYFTTAIIACISAIVDVVLYFIQSKVIYAIIFIVFIIFNIIIFILLCAISRSDDNDRLHVTQAPNRSTIENGLDGQVNDGTKMLPKFEMNVHSEKASDETFQVEKSEKN